MSLRSSIVFPSNQGEHPVVAIKILFESIPLTLPARNLINLAHEYLLKHHVGTPLVPANRKTILVGDVDHAVVVAGEQYCFPWGGGAPQRVNTVQRTPIQVVALYVGVTVHVYNLILHSHLR